jgi:hypothetical protein
VTFVREARDGGSTASRVGLVSPWKIGLAIVLVASRVTPVFEDGLLPEASIRVGQVAVLTKIGAAAATVSSKMTVWIGDPGSGMMGDEDGNAGHDDADITWNPTACR